MDLLQDLDGQTAPESTRGLFDPPPEVKVSNAPPPHFRLLFYSPTTAINIDPKEREEKGGVAGGHRADL